MKKTIFKGIFFLLTFVITLVVTVRIMNKDRDNMTMEMSPASLPVVTFAYEDHEYSPMHGYTVDMDIAFQRDAIAVLGEARDTLFVVDPYGRNITGMRMEVRSPDGKNLIENSPVTEYESKNNRIYGRLVLKDLIEREKEYAITLFLNVDGEEVRYYSRAIWSDNTYLDEKIKFVMDFHNSLYDREEAKSIIRYLESDSRLEDNKSFHYVNIHSSFNQITWGDLPVREIRKPLIRIRELSSQTATIVLTYQVETATESNTNTYEVKELYRIRYTKDRTYLLDYERTMTQIVVPEHMYANNKLLLGIASEDTPLMESVDGNVVVFETGGKLFSYNIATNKLALLFSYYDENHDDARDRYDQHAIRILDVDEGGNVMFSVYGYANRGRHEGQVGIQLFRYDMGLNTIEEMAYIPYDKPFSVLETQIDQLFYMNREQKVYFVLENNVYVADLTTGECVSLVDLTCDGSLYVSDNHRVVVWKEGMDMNHCRQLEIRNLYSEKEARIVVGEEEALEPLGFMGEDVIYGVAREEDIFVENSGHLFFPMYKLCICNSEGKLIKEYQQDGFYVMSCTMEGNQITLKRMSRGENGSYQDALDDHILSSAQEEASKNFFANADIDIYERYIQIQVRKNIDSKTIQILTPKQVLFEGNRNIRTDYDKETDRYYVYGSYGVSGIYFEPANAIIAAYDQSGTVVDGSGDILWKKGNRVSRNQIMAIKEPEKTGVQESLAACLDTILKYEGMVKDTDLSLQEGKTAAEILAENLPDAQVLLLPGCNLDSVLYYVNQDLPVLALLRGGEAVIVTGFNEQNVVLFEPTTGRLYKKGMKDATKLFQENGNSFVTYIRKK